MKCSVRTCTSAGGQARAASVLNLPLFIVSLILSVAGCVTPVRVLEPTTPPPAVQLPEGIWWQVDSDIGGASLAATETARNYARGVLEDWRARVSRRTEEDFIPWFTGYWTQQWLAAKLAWYKLNAEEGLDSAVVRLATYLQEQYQNRVLIPVARGVDPNVIREQATTIYVQSLGEQMRGIQRLHDMSQAEFDRHLEGIPAIALSPPPSHDASLYQVIRADPLASLPAYAALMTQIRKDAGGAEGGSLTSGISPIARRSSEKLAAAIASSGGASAASTVFRGIAGMMISIGAAGFGAIAHEQDRPAMETQLRQDLSTTADDMRLGLMEDRSTGVMAGVHHMSGQIQGRLAKAVTSPVTFDPIPQGVPLSGDR